ncbi:MAG: hypothetical protein AB9869_23760 [Verrucomicrobiia bacterium]
MNAAMMSKFIATSLLSRRTIWFAAVVGCLVAATTAGAQPVIQTQPRDRAVFLGEEVTFHIVAASPTPLGYEWQHDEVVLAGATNASLTVSNVALGDLGANAVLVRNNAGETLSQPAWLKLARWTELLFFGHSVGLMDYTNGKTWYEYLAEMLAIPNTGRRNYAQGGADSAMIRAQIVTYLKSHKPGAHTLVALWFPGDLRTAETHLVVSNMIAQVELLADAGATCFLIPNLANPHHNKAFVPYAQQFTDWNQMLDAALPELSRSRGLSLFRPDMYALEEAIWADPGAYGYTNLTDWAVDCVPRCDASHYYFWNNHHTTATHKVWAPVMYRSLIAPLVILATQRTSGNEVALRWEGGSPPFRPQRCADLARGIWQSDELTFATNAIVPVPGPMQFFRLLNLGQ